MPKNPITEQEKQELRNFARFLSLNTGVKSKMRPVKITVQFEDKTFNEKKGFATVSIPGNSLAMYELIKVLRNQTDSIIDGSYFDSEKDF